jgi:hypothetical protein
MLSLVYVENDPEPNLLTKWGIGILVALFPAGYGVLCIVRRLGYFPADDGVYIPLEGVDAVMFGLALLCAAAWLHFHFFWSQTKRLRQYYEVARICAALGVVFPGLWVAVALFRTTFDLR